MYIGSKYNIDTMIYDIPVMTNSQSIVRAHSWIEVKLDENSYLARAC